MATVFLEIQPDSTEGANQFAGWEAFNAFDYVYDALQALRTLPNTRIVIFTNGDKDQVVGSCNRDPTGVLPALEPFVNLRAKITSASDIASIYINSTNYSGQHQRTKYKPAREMYENLTQLLTHQQQAWLISTNPVDIIGAQPLDMSTLWVNRNGASWTDVMDTDAGLSVRSLRDVYGVLRGQGV